MKNRWVFVIALTLVMIMVLSGCSQSTTTSSAPAQTSKPATTSTTSSPAAKITLRMGAQQAGSTTYVVAAAMSKLVGQYIPNTSMNVVALSGTDVIMKMLPTKEMEMGNTELVSLYEAAMGVGSYAGNRMPARLMFAGQESVWQWFTINSSIQTMADFKGRAIVYLTPGSIIKEYIYKSTFEWMQNAYGFGEKDVKALEWTGTDKEIADLQSGTAQVGSTLAKAASALLQLATVNTNFRIIPYTDEAIKYILQKYPALSRTLIPKGTYGNYPAADIQTIASRNIYAGTHVSDDTVYQTVKAVFENLSEFQGILGKSVGPDFTLQNAIAYPVAPFHAGAIKYYKEKGVWTADLEKQQAAMLAKIGDAK